MSSTSAQLSCTLKNDEVVVDDDLRISFRRTIRVPDTSKAYALPPTLGKFPLRRVSDYVNTLPETMVRKGGMFFTMYQREAMWIDFECRKPYLITIYCGGVNAISGASPTETFTTKLKQIYNLTESANKKETLRKLQDYVVVPNQRWLDGIASENGIVKQFVAMPLGSGYSVEAQVTGQEVTGGLQFEVTPLKLKNKITRKVRKGTLSSKKFLSSKRALGGEGTIEISVETLTGKTLTPKVDDHTTTLQLKTIICDMEGIPPDQQRMVFEGRTLEGMLLQGLCVR
jgi:hypothetical protein